MLLLLLGFFYSTQVRCSCLPALVPAAIVPQRAPDVEITARGRAPLWTRKPKVYVSNGSSTPTRDPSICSYPYYDKPRLLLLAKKMQYVKASAILDRSTAWAPYVQYGLTHRNKYVWEFNKVK